MAYSFPLLKCQTNSLTGWHIWKKTEIEEKKKEKEKTSLKFNFCSSNCLRVYCGPGTMLSSFCDLSFSPHRNPITQYFYLC